VQTPSPSTMAKYAPYASEREGAITHEMHSDLSRYFINTSVNTVALGNGKVGANAISKAFQAGARAVEFEVSNNNPKKKLEVKVAGSAKSVDFEKCIKTVFKHAFVTSQYPCIIRLKTLCDLEGLVLVSQILEKELKGKLYVPSDDLAKPFQSPELMKGLFILSCDLKCSAGDFPPELKRLVYIGDLNLAQFSDGAISQAPVTGSEEYDEESVELQSKSMLTFTAKHLACVRPTRTRIDSNYNASSVWYAGAQMCGVNFHAGDLGAWLNATKFVANAGVGFLRRPDWQLGKGTRPEKLDSSQKKYLKVTVLGASAAKKGELSVKLLFTGSSSDTVKATKTYGPTKSATMKEAAWVLPVAATDTAIAMFVLKDKLQVDQSPDGAATVGWYGVNIADMREGRVALPLFKPDGGNSKCEIQVELKWQ